jgi:serralysin
MDGTARGGNDHLNGGDGNDILYGDAYAMHNNAEGGNDQFTGGNNTSSSPMQKFFYGDAHDMYDNARGGNDTLTS